MRLDHLGPGDDRLQVLDRREILRAKTAHRLGGAPVVELGGHAGPPHLSSDRLPVGGRRVQVGA